MNTNELVARAQTADLNWLLSTIDQLYGRENLRYGDSLEDVRRECINQIFRDAENCRAALRKSVWAY